MDSQEIVNNAINELIEEFYSRRNYFFKEHEFHSIFYSKLLDLGDLVHPEYPTHKKFIRIRKKSEGKEYRKGVHCFPASSKKGTTGTYDIVILNENFIREYQDQFDKLANNTRNINCDVNYKYIDTAIEFKYIKSYFDPLEIKYDLFKLGEAEEIRKKMLLIFIRKGKMKDEKYVEMIEFLRGIEQDENGIEIKIIE